MDGILPPAEGGQKPENADAPEGAADSKRQVTNSNELSNVASAKEEITAEGDLSTEALAEGEADEAVVAGVAAIGGIALKWHHFKQFFKSWWNNKKARYWTLGGAGVFLVALFIIPLTRYGILNAMGFSGDVSLSVYDSQTHLPLKNATIKIGGAEAKTGDDGRVYVVNAGLGRQELLIAKPGYGDELTVRHVGFGLSDFGNIDLIATGTRFSFRVVDFHSGQPIAGALAEVGDASAFSDSDGLLRLVTEPSDEPIRITFSEAKYNNLELDSDPVNMAEQEVELVTKGWHAFISKRGGELDLYRSRFDGSEQSVVLAGNGNERGSSLALSPAPDGVNAAFVSTRDGERNEDGYVLSGLFVVNLETKELIRTDLAESINIVGWVNDELVYVSQAAGESGYSPNRMQIKHFKLGSLTGAKLVGSNYFNQVLLAKGRVYFAPSQSFKQSTPKEYFFSVLPDGTDERSHIQASTGRIAQTGFDKLVVETYNEKQGFKQTWYEFLISSQTPRKLTGRPASFEYWNNSGEFVSSQDGSKTAWLDERDGRKIIIVRGGAQNGGEEKEVWRGLGAIAPLRWIGNDLLVFRVNKDGVYDYAVSVNGGEAVKLGDVTNVSGEGNLY